MVPVGNPHHVLEGGQAGQVSGPDDPGPAEERGPAGVQLAPGVAVHQQEGGAAGVHAQQEEGEECVVPVQHGVVHVGVLVPLQRQRHARHVRAGRAVVVALPAPAVRPRASEGAEPVVEVVGAAVVPLLHVEPHSQGRAAAGQGEEALEDPEVLLALILVEHLGDGLPALGAPEAARVEGDVAQHGHLAAQRHKVALRVADGRLDPGTGRVLTQVRAEPLQAQEVQGQVRGAVQHGVEDGLQSECERLAQCPPFCPCPSSHCPCRRLAPAPSSRNTDRFRRQTPVVFFRHDEEFLCELHRFAFVVAFRRDEEFLCELHRFAFVVSSRQQGEPDDSIGGGVLRRQDGVLDAGPPLELELSDPWRQSERRAVSPPHGAPLRAAGHPTVHDEDEGCKVDDAAYAQASAQTAFGHLDGKRKAPTRLCLKREKRP